MTGFAPNLLKRVADDCKKSKPSAIWRRQTYLIGWYDLRSEADVGRRWEKMSFSDNQLPKVTICVPVRNGARTIHRTLDSLLNQDYPNYEIIVSDNCSDDDTAKIVSQYASNGVKYFFNPVLDKWGESNWNHILTLAEGPLIALYHADDIYAPTMVRRQVEFLQKNSHASAVFTMSQIINEKDLPIRMKNFTLPKEYKGKHLFSFPDLFNAALKYGTITVVPTMMARKVVLDQVGNFNWQQFCSAADIDLYLRMAQVGPIGIIDEPLHKYRQTLQQETKLYNNSRTHSAHFFLALDHHLSIPDARWQAMDEALFYYELQRTSDDITRAVNMVVLGNYSEALDLLNSVFGRKEYHAGLHKKKYMRHFFLTLLLFGVLRCGLGRLAGNFYRKYYRPWRQQRQIRPLIK